MTPDLQLAIAVRESLTGPEVWIKGLYARDASGQDVGVSDPSASCLCISGWSMRKAQQLGVNVFPLLYALRALTGAWSLTDWNDEPDRTFEEVVALVDTSFARLMFLEALILMM